MDVFEQSGRKSGFTTTIVEGSLMKNEKRWGGAGNEGCKKSGNWFESSSSTEGFNLGSSSHSRTQSGENTSGGGGGGVELEIHKTVEFESSSTVRNTPTPERTVGWPLTGGV